ncbi:MAG: hypothetical protein IPH84_11360 [Bacteroidales bacterium]|nr:hypothetical protein [Bacteroidales bacterium]
MKRLTFLALLMISFALIAVSQVDNPAKGYLVTMKGDTIWGRISDLYGINRSTEINFIPTDGNSPRILDTKDIFCFYDHENGYYFSSIVPVDYSPVELSSLRQVPEPDLRVERVFLKLMSGGRMNLYSYLRGGGRQLFFVSKTNDTIIPLIDYTYFYDGYEYDERNSNKVDSLKNVSNNHNQDYVPGGVPSSIHLAKYKGQLSYLMSDWPEIQREIGRLAYKQKEIVQLVDNYNYYFDPSLKNSRPGSKISETYFGISFGTGIGKFNYLKANTYKEAYEFGFDVPLRISGFYEIIPTKFNGHVKFQNLLSLDWYQSRSTRTYFQAPVDITENLVFSPVSLMLTNNIKICTNKSPVLYYFTLGISNSYILTSKNKLIKTSLLGQTESELEMEVAKDLVKYHISYIVGIGADYKNYAFELRFDPPREYTKYSFNDASHQALLLMVSYHF